MARYPVNPYPHPSVPLALQYLRSRSGLTRASVSAMCDNAGQPISASYLAQLEAPRTEGSKSFRVPSVEKLTAVLVGLGLTLPEFETILQQAPWDHAVEEGDEWLQIDSELPVDEMQLAELVALFSASNTSARLEILSAARRAAR